MKESQLSPLFTVSEGQGRPLLVLHGWGMNQAVWQPIRTQLAKNNRVTWIDLPGHGRSVTQPMGTLDDLVKTLGRLIEPGTMIMGWSLGGLIAQALAKAFPEQVRALILVASTPCFTQNEHWPYGLAKNVLAGFADNLEKDYQGTVKRFFALQFMGVRSDPAAIKALQQAVLSHPADKLALKQGLDILNTADFSDDMPEHPVLWLCGKLDKLIPVSLATELQQNNDVRHHRSQVIVMPGAAHVPFVTQPDLFLDHVDQFIGALP